MSTTLATSEITETTTLGNITVAYVNASGGDITITLPDAEGIEGRFYYIKRIDTSGNAVVVQPDVDNFIQGNPVGFPMFFGEIYSFHAQTSNNWQILTYTNQ